MNSLLLSFPRFGLKLKDLEVFTGDPNSAKSAVGTDCEFISLKSSRLPTVGRIKAVRKRKENALNSMILHEFIHLGNFCPSRFLVGCPTTCLPTRIPLGYMSNGKKSGTSWHNKKQAVQPQGVLQNREGKSVVV